MRVGISYGSRLSTMSPEAIDAAFADALQLGASWVRDDLSWSRVQPTPGAYNWESFDAVVDAADAHGLSVVPILVFTPAWARPAGCNNWACAPAPDAFAKFARDAANRYAPRGVHTWEIWNEPNKVGFWQPQPSAAAYGELLRQAAQAIKAVDPSATVVSGGLAPAATQGGNVEQRSFLASLCSAGGLTGVDAVGVHPYSSPVLPSYSADWNAWQQISHTEVSIRSVLRACGASDRGIWATEFGAPTGGPGAGSSLAYPNLAADPDHVDEATQAAILREAVDLAATDPALDALFLYTDTDRGTSTATVENFFGLRRFDGSPKPAWFALREAIAQLPRVG